MKRKFASFARRRGSAASGGCRWKILLTICTKQNRSVDCRCGGFPNFFSRQEDNISREKAARKLTACFKYACDIQPPINEFTNRIRSNQLTTVPEKIIKR